MDNFTPKLTDAEKQEATKPVSINLEQKTIDDFFAAFGFDQYDKVCFRLLKPKNAPDSFAFPKSTSYSRHEFKDQNTLAELNRTNEKSGIYFCPNAGGQTDAEITRFHAFFVESDTLTIAEQNARLDVAPFKTSIRVETKKSVHAYYLVNGDCTATQWREIQELLIAYFDGDKSIKNPSRVMRVPGFNHLTYVGDGKPLEKKRVEIKQFNPERRYTFEEMKEAFSIKKDDEKTFNDDLQTGSEPTRGEMLVFADHDSRHAELCRLIGAKGKKNSRGNYDMRCPAHDGKGETSLCWNPQTNAVWCNKGCDYHDILRAFGLPDGYLPDDPLPKQWSDPKPLDLTLKPVDTIDDNCLPEILVDWLRPASKVIGCPFDFLVLSAVVTVSALIGSRLRVKPSPFNNWLVVPNLYAGLVGLPSQKKTPALDEIRKPVLELQAKAREKYQTAKNDYEIDAKFYEKESNKILKESASRDDYKRNIANLNESKPVQPTLERYEINDITTAKLMQFLAENPNGLMLFRDELMGWLRSLEAEYDKSARPFFLELWKGGISYEMSRVSDNREIHITSGTLSIIGGIQPSKLQKYVSEAYSFDNSDGFLQRFLFAYPDSKNKLEKGNESDYKAMLIGFEKANATVKTIAEYDFHGKIISANGDIFHAVKFSQAAQLAVDEWQNEIEAEAIELQTEDEAFSNYLSKLPKSCYAIALIFHCLENIRQQNFPNEISEVTVFKAITYTEVLISHARRVFALGENQIFALAHTLLVKIKKGELKQGFTRREVSRKNWSGLKSDEAIQDVINLLIDYGYLRELKTKGEGRPTNYYYFHPALENEAKNEEN